jgi:hypothetical protein
MRYVITKNQFHKVVYKILDDIIEEGGVKREENPYSGGAYRIHMYNGDDEEIMVYFYYPPGEDDDGNPHDGHGSLQVNWIIDNKISKIFSIRQSKTLDIIADWVSDKFNVDIDEVVIYPKK